MYLAEAAAAPAQRSEEREPPNRGAEGTTRPGAGSLRIHLNVGVFLCSDCKNVQAALQRFKTWV